MEEISMLDKNANPKDFYKIGTGWVFDTVNNKGYIVKREKTARGYNGKILDFIPAFELIKTADGKYKSVIKVTVPAGVLRKAVEMAQLKEQGKLKTRRRVYR